MGATCKASRRGSVRLTAKLAKGPLNVEQLEEGVRVEQIEGNVLAAVAYVTLHLAVSIDRLWSPSCGTTNPRTKGGREGSACHLYMQHDQGKETQIPRPWQQQYHQQQRQQVDPP